MVGLKDTVEVCRDSWGVPHLYAENEEDLFYAFGYVQAQDRLWQMDFQLRVAEGKLAEVLGEDLYGTDLFFRVVGLARANIYGLNEVLEECTIR
ncbi:MAG: Penicillin amidase [Candidatus Bathyarchaeota archaeon BA1]|nr:MAG: Penicillin amidase [Candidatus Bathyarchaeota archaeon BA1]